MKQANKSRDLVEANLVIYSVTDRASFQYAQSCLQELRPAKRHNVVILVANKQDIVRNRVISEQGQYCTRYNAALLLRKRVSVKAACGCLAARSKSRVRGA